MIKPILSSNFISIAKATKATRKVDGFPITTKPKVAALDFDDLKAFVKDNIDDTPILGEAYRTVKTAKTIGKGDAAGVANGVVGFLEAGVKNTLAVGVGTVGAVLGPVGAVGGYTATIVAWNKVRSSIIKAIFD